jgi:hypothetical protein
MKMNWWEQLHNIIWERLLNQELRKLIVDRITQFWAQAMTVEKCKSNQLTGVEKIFYFLGPQENIENFLQIIKKIDTRIL